jgi:N6-L-threonylcarbamoyladenine synthase
MKILGIETSCDETSAAIVENGDTLKSCVVSSSIGAHVKRGGVVPEVAARAQIEVIISVIEQSLAQAKCDWQDIDAIAVTYGPGLGGSLLVGVLTARTLALVKGKPLYGVNHALAHVYANFLTKTDLSGYVMRPSQPKFPMLAVIVSGGHTHLLLLKSHFDYQLLGQTRDDAIGEAFDKVAKMLGLPYPGGPAISEAARAGDPYAFKLPKARMPGLDFSFSGLKTAVLRLAQAQIGESYDFPSTGLPERLSGPQKTSIAASFQRIAVETVIDRVKQAYEQFQPKSLVVAGGVAANLELRRQLSEAVPLDVQYPDIKLCTDNGAMVATLGCYMVEHNQPKADPLSLDIDPGLSL